MPWEILQTSMLPETEIQQVFERWQNRPGTAQQGTGQPGNGQPGNGQPGNGQPGNTSPEFPWNLAGIPSWLDDIRLPNTSRRFWLNGEYSFWPDVLWETDAGTWVGELKSHEKSQPLAIPEVLHHAAMLETFVREPDATDRSNKQKARLPRRPIRPFIVTRYTTPWTRAALHYMLENGFRRDLIRYVDFRCIGKDVSPDLAQSVPTKEPDSLPEDEVECLTEATPDDNNSDTHSTHPSPVDRHLIFWFDDVLAPWERVVAPSDVLPKSFVGLWPYWHRVPETGAWIGSGATLVERPLLWRQKYVMVQQESAGNRFLIWYRNPNAATLVDSRTGQFHRWTPGDETGDPPPGPDGP